MDETQRRDPADPMGSAHTTTDVEPAAPTPAATPAPAAASVHSARARAKGTRFIPATARGVLVDLVTITAGVLIALSFEGVRQWVQDRRLVATAQATIDREIRDNRDEVQSVIDSAPERRQSLDRALQLANDLIEGQPSVINSMNLGFTIAELSAASWETAQRAGALTHMDYDQARTYARVYEAQARFTALQDRMLARLESAAAVASGDPRGLLPEDLQTLRQQVLGMIGELSIERQLATRLLELYDEVLGAETSAGGGS